MDQAGKALRVGFIGLGDIGAPMAERIVKGGFPLLVWNRTAAKMQALVDAGAERAASPADLARRVDVVCLCVTDDKAVEEVVFGADGIASLGRADHIVCDHSTIHPITTRALAQRLEQACGATWLDIPISGGSIGARAGTLAAFGGGDATAIERVRPVIASFAATFTRMGDSGCGQATKSCNQMINVGTVAAIAEAMNFGSRFGLDVSKLPEALAGGFADSSILRNYAPKMAAGTFSGSTLTTLKDLNIVLDVARQTDSALPVISMLASFYRMLIARGYSEDGMAGMMRMYTEQPLKPAATPSTPSPSTPTL
ncbi:MAG: NAD(P)-dependent oxidoreductase [Janthinobacterium lividum]